MLFVLAEFVFLAFDAAYMSVWRLHLVGHHRVDLLHSLLVDEVQVVDDFAAARIPLVGSEGCLRA